MAKSGTLYSWPNNFRTHQILIAAEYSGFKVNIPKDFEFGKSNKNADFVAKFSSPKVPAFEGADGTILTSVSAITYFVSNEQLRGKTEAEKSKIFDYVSFAQDELMPNACRWVFPILQIYPYNKQTVDSAKDGLKRTLAKLDKHLLTRTYLVGDSITLADICSACTLLQVYENAMDPTFRKPYINVNRWFTTIINQPQFKKIAGEVKLCEKQVNEAALASETNVSAAAPAKAKEEKPKKEKKEAPKKEKEADPAEDDPMDDILAAEPPSKDPFDLLPKGTFNLEDYKRFYSNNDEAKSIPYFWEKFDKENYSIWFGEYKYPEELQKVFMSCNLITGMYQRLDKMRKQCFASCCLFGSDNDSSISGVWVWRGHDLAFELSPDWKVDYESYEWKKLDADAKETKDLVAQYFSWVGTDKKGRKFNQGKIFK
uniref:eEF-1B gamma n=1 Tax=Cacopsylla melanoneura TaxID=428564 RepID=A0A8D8SKR9_9HEMI